MPKSPVTTVSMRARGRDLPAGTKITPKLTEELGLSPAWFETQTRLGRLAESGPQPAQEPASPPPAAPDDPEAGQGSLELTEEQEGDGSRPGITAQAEALAAEHGIDPAAVTGTGKGGRITKGDMEAAIAIAQAGDDSGEG